MSVVVCLVGDVGFSTDNLLYGIGHVRVASSMHYNGMPLLYKQGHSGYNKRNRIMLFCFYYFFDNNSFPGLNTYIISARCQ